MASTSASSSCPPRWDVFLSFHGEDTRRNIIESLYVALDEAKIPTFRDDIALKKGQEISAALLSAIKDSNMYIVVISENYARSSWCLDELVEILKCKRTKKHVVPVFYYVDPSDVRYQKGSFGDALDYQKMRHSVDTIDRWKFALAEIGGISGYHLKIGGNENESYIVQTIVENIASGKVLVLEDYLIGMETAVEEIYDKLSLESDDVRAMGICGMQGIGKTTIAKVFYNKYFNQFDISCFLENMKQYSQLGHSPLRRLLKEILIRLLRITDYKVPDVASGMRQLKLILSFRKALIVLDGLDDSIYLEFLAPICNFFSAGSRIIITTSDVKIINHLKVDISVVDTYMVKELSERESLKLFSYHAFGKPTPPQNFRELSERHVSRAGGLPSAIRELGSSYSFGNTELGEKVGGSSEGKITKNLELSYHELDDETLKEIFLDIVFFFVGKDGYEAVQIFESCDFFPYIGIVILQEKCLLTIDEDNKFQMHNHIQSMGKEVIGEQSKQGYCRYLCLDQGNACETLLNLERRNTIQGLILDLTFTEEEVSAEIFEMMPILRLLEIIDAHEITGDLKNSFNELRSIRWSHCPWDCLPSHFHPRKLVSLDMPSSEFKILWKGTKPLRNLKIINVSYSRDLVTTPDFTGSNYIEKLLLRGCTSLLKLHPSIGVLTELDYLDLGECGLKELPESIGQLTKLDHLNLHDCVKLKQLPETITQLRHLSRLNMGGCRDLKRLPEQLGDMKGLKMLDVSCSPIEQLPDSIVHLDILTELKVQNCKKLRKLPEQFGCMEGLRIFDASSSAIERLPDSFERLIDVIELNLKYCKNLRIVQESMRMKLRESAMRSKADATAHEVGN